MMTVVLIYILVTGLIGMFDMSTYTVICEKTIIDWGLVTIRHGSRLKGYE